MDTEELEEEFHVSRIIILYKIVSGLLELILGMGIMVFGNQLFRVYINFRRQELLEDPHDLLVRLLEKFVPYLWENHGYIIFILFALGIVKVAGSIGLLYRKHWGLDLLVGLTVLMLPFEGYNLLRHLSLTNLLYFVINLGIAFYLVNFKPRQYYHHLKRRIRTKALNN